MTTTKIIKSVIAAALSYFFILGQTVAIAQSTAAILPQGVTQFSDNNGNPLTSGKVYFYVPSTLTNKTTWQNSIKSIANANPVILDAGGRATIYGDGTYRQIVKDRNGNLIYDAVTASAGSGSSTTSTGDGDLVATIKPWAGLVAPNQYAFAYGQEVSRTTYSVLYTAITLQQTISCTSGSSTASGFSDTSQIPTNAIIESTCFAAGTKVVSKTTTTVTFNANSSISTTDNVRIFLYGNGNGSTTFNLPDLRGYVVAGRSNMGGTASTNLTSTYFGSNPQATGAKGGLESSTLILDNLLPYTPSGTVVAAGTINQIIPSGTISQITPAGTVSAPTITVANGTLQVSGDGAVLNLTASGALGQTKTITATSSAPIFSGTPVTPTFNGSPVTPVFTNNGSTFSGSAQGGTGTSFSNISPTQTLNYIIKITPDTNSTDASGVASLGSMTGDISCGSGLTCTGNIISVTASPFSLTNNWVFVGNASNVPTGVPMSGDCTIVASGAITCSNSKNNLIPGGRLTLTASTPVMTASVTAGTTVYYAPYTGIYTSIYNGTSVLPYQFTSSSGDTVGLTVTLGANWAANSNYDWFVGLNSSVVTLCSGPVWSSDTVRGTGAGTTELELFGGYQTNKNSMTCRYGNSTTFTCAVHQCTYLGSMRTGNAGQTNYIFGAAAAGGLAGNFGIWNMYNRVIVRTFVADTTNSWTYDGNCSVACAWRAANNSSTIRVSSIRGFDQDGISVIYQATGQSNGTDLQIASIGINSTTAFATGASTAGSTATTTSSFSGQYSGLMGLGYNYVSAIEYNNTTFAATWYGDGGLSYYQTGLHIELVQ